MTSWEYKIITTEKSFWSGKDKSNTEQLLANLGMDEWELASSVPLMSGGSTTSVQFFFKRKRF